MRPASVTFTSSLVALTTILAAYVGFLFLRDQENQFLLDVIESPMIYIPRQLWPFFLNGGLEAVLVCVGVLIAHGIVLAVAGTAIGHVVGRQIYKPPLKLTKRPARTADRLRFDDSQMPITVMAPEHIDPRTREKRSAKPINILFDDTQIRLNRSAVSISRQPKTPLEELEYALVQILYAHRDWTCDPAGHHATVGLFEHSKAVMTRMAEQSQHPLARVVGWSHDIGKLLAYEYKGGKWHSKSKRHDRMSGEIVRHLPEFWKLSEMDRRTLSRVLSYSHAEKLPMTLSDEARELISALKIADGISTRNDKATSKQALGQDAVKKAVQAALQVVIPTLNINDMKKNGKAAGWTIEGVSYVAVTESAVRESIGPHLEHRIAQLVQADVSIEGNREHPLTRAIVDALREQNLLIERYGGSQPVEAHDGLFDVKSGRVKFIDVLLLDKQKLQEMHEGLVERWKSSGYPLRIMPSRRASADSETPEPS